MTSWFFIEMAAKSALICSIALLLAIMLRHRAAADRSMVLRVGVGLLLALPLIDVAFPVLQIEVFAAPAAATEAMSQAELAQLLAIAASLPPAEASIWDDPTPLILILWAAGALAVLSRLAVGLATLRRWTRAAESVTDSHWNAALQRAIAASGAPDNLRLMVGDGVPGPLGWGWRNPVILLDYDTLAETEEADAILAHEVAHVARRDWPALMATRLAKALFWFNPLVWTLAREAVQQAEEAADAHAARLVEPIRYAETLLSWGQIGRGIAVPANSIAPGARALSRRVRAVLDKGLVERSAGSRLAVIAILLSVGVAAPVAALELVEAARPDTPATPPAPTAPVAALAAASLDAPAAPAQPEAADEDEPDAPEAADAPDLAEVNTEALGPALAEMRRILPTIPHITAQAMRAIDVEELARTLRRVHVNHPSEAELRAALARAHASMPSPEMIAAHVRQIDPRELEARIRAAMPDERTIRAQVRNAMRSSRAGMEQGARSMEQGAATMQAQARRFRDRQERERIIARERERGKTVTHEELLRAADEMEQGAREMREGAEDMRRAAREMDQED